MTAYKKDSIDRKSLMYGGAPYGNKTVLEFSLTTDSSGIVENSDATAALGSGDTVKLGILPAGFRLMDCLSLVSNTFTAASTIALGFSYTDGVDDSTVPQDADYFHAALALDAASRTRANNTAVRPVTLPKDAYLVATHSAHTQAEAGILDIFVEGIAKGAP